MIFMTKDEKRGVYRLDDKLSFNFTLIYADDNEIDNDGLLDFFLSETEKHDYSLKEALYQLDMKTHNLPALVSKLEPAQRQIFHYLNDKITLLFQHRFKKDRFNPKPVNLSASGMAFLHDKTIPVNHEIGLCLYLLPYYSPEIIRAKVIYCKEQENHQHKVAVSFKDLNEAQEAHLYRHLMLRQNKLKSINQ